MESATDVLTAVAADSLSLLTVHSAVVAALDIAELVVVHRSVAFVLNHLGAIVLRQQVQVFLGMDVDLFLVRFVLEPQFVAALTLVGLGLESGSGLVLRQRVRRGVGGVVGSSGNDRLVRVAVQKADDDFVADSRQRHEAILATGPALADSEPGAAVFVVF